MKLSRSHRQLKSDWRPSWGAWREGAAIRFRVWAPTRHRVDLVVEKGGGAKIYALEHAGNGVFGGRLTTVSVGDRYRYRLDGEGPYPDPASRFQPEGVHGASQVVDARRFRWTDANWRGPRRAAMVFYELHVGTFTPEGTFAGVMKKLPNLRDLGVTVIELMPLAAFAGERNWGYDGVALFAPARGYGQPDDLRRLVDTAHRLGLAVILDVVFNHVGPDGAYLGVYSPYYFSTRHRTPWGVAMNLDGPHSAMVRDFFVECATHWIHEYHLDGLRFDATHALIDDSPQHFIAELAQRLRATVAPRRILLIAEDHRNLDTIVRPVSGGWGLDGVWADDFHHQLRRRIAGDKEGYYRDFSGSMADLATTLRRGWFYVGQHSIHHNGPRGTGPSGIPPGRFVICLQNHDQVGNRALGERLHFDVDLAAYRAATVLLLCAPETPLLFMGQEWAASTPFLFFTDHRADLGRLVTRGRRREFQAFAAFADPGARRRIPDPQDPETFARSRLLWKEISREPHAGTLRLYRALLALRRTEPLLRRTSWSGYDAYAVGHDALITQRMAAGRILLVAVQLRGRGRVAVRPQLGRRSLPALRWRVLLNTEEPPFTIDPQLVRIEVNGRTPVVHFSRPGAVIFIGSARKAVGQRS